MSALDESASEEKYLRPLAYAATVFALASIVVAGVVHVRGAEVPGSTWIVPALIIVNVATMSMGAKNRRPSILINTGIIIISLAVVASILSP
jgi:hypothetical protein